MSKKMTKEQSGRGTKNRPNEIKLGIPKKFRDEFEPMLKRNLLPETNLTLIEEQETGKLIYTFWPTKEEHFFISLMVVGIAKKLGGKQVINNKIKETK